MVRNPTSPIFSAVDLEREIEQEFRSGPLTLEPQPSDFAPPAMRAAALPIPDYVEHREGATKIGKLSAQAVLGEYEAAAKEIEAVGANLTERVKQCEEMVRDATLSSMEEMKETAARYRHEAKRIFVCIENCSAMIAEVRKTCAELTEKITRPETEKRSKRKK